MKKLTTVFAALLISASVTFANTINEKKRETSYEVSMYFDGNSNTLKTFYKKRVGQNLHVQLKTATGKTLHKAHVTKKADIASIHFDVGNLPDGTYILEISDGDVSTTKTVTLDTTKPMRIVKY